MRTASAKAKGRRLQQYVRDTLLALAAHLTPDDIRSTSMGASGEDILMSPAAREVFPYTIECKNVEKLNIHAALEQAEAKARDGITPIVVFKRNHSKTYVALEFETFLRLTRK